MQCALVKGLTDLNDGFGVQPQTYQVSNKGRGASAVDFECVHHQTPPTSAELMTLHSLSKLKLVTSILFNIRFIHSADG